MHVTTLHTVPRGGISSMPNGSLILALVFVAMAAFGQAPAPAPEAVRVASEKKADEPDRIEWVYTLTCPADNAAPSLRVTLGNLSTSASAGITMAAGPDGWATGTITLRVQARDKEARTVTLSVEVGAADNAAMAGQTVRLPQGQDLTAVAALKALPAEAQLRRAMVLGNIGGCMVSAYVMPGRSGVRNPMDTTPPPGDPALQTAEVFRSWVRGVKNGDLGPFGAVVPPNEWNGMDTAQRTRRLQEYQQAFKTVLGDDYRPEEFKIEYTSGSSASSGKLKIRYGDKELPELNVRYFGGKWVLSEP